MPIYEYACKQCGKVTELLQKMGAETAGMPCPACGADALVKKLSVTAPAQVAAQPAGCELAKKHGGCGGCCGGGH